ncbi:MAG: type II toxin-antitoxin system prevent-host-death family antitoxin [Propionicimonas sp.]|nr:type II toxin-antitoxin system prevent-host-death family antitoxin [Propionicimonas sp.]
MAGTTITSREFNRDGSAAKRAAEQGPVTITDHGRRSHVLMTAADFDRLSGEREVVGDRLWARGTEHIELELLRRQEAKRSGISR